MADYYATGMETEKGVRFVMGYNLHEDGMCRVLGLLEGNILVLAWLYAGVRDVAAL